MSEASDRYLSGIQPSGDLHLGNYFGAIKQHVALQSAGNSFYFIANYHALTSSQDPDALRRATFDVAATYLALGIDPEKSVLFRQSDVPEVTELTWLLLTVTPMGLLERAVSYKDKVTKGLEANAGLFTYPVLMASDILAYDSTVVPVGQDQIQHIEMTRDIAQKFNNRYGEVFTIPTARLSDAPYVPGVDGLKMSKSYGNTIPIFADAKLLKQRVDAIITDSTPLAEPKQPEERTVFNLYSLFAVPEERNEMAAKYREGGYGDGHAKRELLAKINSEFAVARETRLRLEREKDYVEDVLRAGAQVAREIARHRLERARLACGL